MILGLILISTSGIIAITLIEMWYPDRTNTVLIATILSFLAPTLIGLVIALKVMDVQQGITELTHELNSRMTELLEATRGRAEAEARADERRQIDTELPRGRDG